jgi:sugar/nucleoside kinase (ribokinase family)
MSNDLDVLGVGIAAVDDLIYVAEYPTVDCKIPTFGKARQGGGPACTAIAAVGSLGGRAAYVAQFGDNELSGFIRSALIHHGVDVSHIVHDPLGGPYHSTIVVDRCGHRNVFYDPTLYRPFVSDRLPDAVIKSARVVLLDHITEPSLVPIAKRANALAVPVLGDIEGCTKSARELAGLVDYLVVPHAWALWATGASGPSEACAVLARTERSATVVTDSASGCYWSSNSAPAVRHFPAFEVDVFDSNGCGDTFHGAFALAVARGLAMEEAIPFASAAAALKARARGGDSRGWDALPSLEEIFEFLQSRLPESEGHSLLRKLEAHMTAASEVI